MCIRDSTNTELSYLNADTLTIGNGTGAIDVKGVTDGSDADIDNGVTLSGTNVTFDTAASTFEALTVTATGVVDIDVNITTDVGAMSLTGSTAGADGDNMAIATGVTLNATGNLTLANDSTDALDIVGEGVLNLTTAGVLTISNAVDANGALTLTAANITLSAVSYTHLRAHET